MIKLFKLITGHEIIANVSEEYHSTDSFLLENPINILLTAEGIGMLPFLAFAEENEVIIQKEHILCGPLEVEAEIKNSYNEKYGSGIVFPTEPKIY